MLLLNVTEVTAENQNWPKISTNIVKTIFLAKGQKSFGLGPKPSAGECSPPTMCQISQVTCHVSSDPFSPFFYKMMELDAEGSVINGACPV